MLCRCFHILRFCLVLLSSSLIYSPLLAKDQPVELLNADFSELRVEKENTIVNLVGNVRFRHEDAILNSDRAVWYRNSGQIIFMGNVRVEDDERILYANRVVYFHKTKRVDADGNVKLLSKKDKSLITGEHGEYDRQSKYARFILQPRLVSDYTNPDSAVTVDSKVMEYFIDEKRGIASGDVKIIKAKMKAFCDTAFYYSQENKIVLKSNPRAEQEESELSGKEIEIMLGENRIKQLIVRGDAKTTHRELADSGKASRESFLAGKQINFLLEEDKLKEVKVFGNASSLYYSSAKDTLHRGKNEASGDTINLFLENSEVKRVLVMGGAMGTYYNPIKIRNDSLIQEDTIKYSAENIDYVMDEEMITLMKNSYLEFGQTSLKAGQVKYYIQKEVLLAEGIPVKKDSSEAMEELPVLKDGKDEIVGQNMVYNLKTRRGKIRAGETEFNKGIFTGDEIRKVENKVLFVDRGIYTTCQNERPHYHFESRKMKILADDKVIVEPLVFYMADLPVMAIPFYIFPIKPGRHSGFTTFDLGNLESNQRFIRNFGYYWTFSDYWDLKTTLDYYEGRALILHGRARYKIRYILDGSLSGSYTRESYWSGYGQTRKNRWDLAFDHRHYLSASSQLSGSGVFVSDAQYYRDVSLNEELRRNRSLSSKVAFTSRWSNWSINLAVDRELNLDTDEQTDMFPDLSLSKPDLPLFKTKDSNSKSEDRSWYNSIYYSYSSNLQNYSNRSKQNEEFKWKKYATFDHRLFLRAPQTVFGWLVIGPSFNYQETWYYVSRTSLSQEKGIVDQSLARRGAYSTSLSAGTHIYGTFYPGMVGVKGLRHVVDPSLSFTYQPEFTQHDDYKSYTGRGGGSGAKSQSLSFSLRNTLQMKYGKLDQEKNLDLFNLNFSSGYNFVKKDRKLSNLLTSFGSRAAKIIDLDVQAVHDFYDERTKELKLLSPRLVSFSLSTTFSIFGKGIGPAEPFGDTLPTYSDEDLVTVDQAESKGWSLRVTQRYNEDRSSVGINKNHWAEASLGLPLTRGWFLSYLNRYDFKEKKITSQRFELYRDMHCWEGKFVWVVNGFRRGYYFKVNIRLLPEVKIEKSERGLKEMFF